MGAAGRAAETRARGHRRRRPRGRRRGGVVCSQPRAALGLRRRDGRAGLPGDVGLGGGGGGAERPGAPDAGGGAGRPAAALAALVAKRVAGAATTAMTTIALRITRLPSFAHRVSGGSLPPGRFGRPVLSLNPGCECSRPAARRTSAQVALRPALRTHSVWPDTRRSAAVCAFRAGRHPSAATRERITYETRHHRPDRRRGAPGRRRRRARRRRLRRQRRAERRRRDRRRCHGDARPTSSS